MAEEKKISSEKSDIHNLLKHYIKNGKGKDKEITNLYHGDKLYINKLLYSYLLYKYKNTCGKLFLAFCPKDCVNIQCLEKKENDSNKGIDYRDGNFCNIEEGEQKEKIGNYMIAIAKIKKCMIDTGYANIAVNIQLTPIPVNEPSHANVII